MKEVIRDGDNGLLVGIFKPDDIAERVIDVWANTKAYDTIRQHARRTIVEKYDLKSITRAVYWTAEFLINESTPSDASVTWYPATVTFDRPSDVTS